MEINNTYVWHDRDKIRNNHFLLPKSIRCLLIGSSSSGKTTIMNNLLLRPGLLDYNRLYVFGHSLSQPEYKIMKAGFNKKLSKEQMGVIFSNQNLVNKNGGPLKVIDEYNDICRGNIIASFYENCSDVPDPSELDENMKNCLVFDDCMLDEQTKTSSYFTRGRHSFCDVFYISQSYFILPRKSIRINCNFIILFRQGKKDLQHLYQDHVACDGIPFEIFVNEFCVPSWNSNPYAFIVIDLTRTKYSGKYRLNFDRFWIYLDGDNI